MINLLEDRNKIKQLTILFNIFNPYEYYDEEIVFYFCGETIMAKSFKSFRNSEEGFYINLFYTKNFEFEKEEIWQQKKI